MSLRAVFFDLDGTLVDSEPVAQKALENRLKSWGAFQKNPMRAREALALIPGRKAEVAIRHIMAHGLSPVSFEETLELLTQDYVEEIRYGRAEILGAADAVRALSSEFELALVSGSRREEILLHLDILEVRDCFKVILGAEDYQESKPSPEGYRKAMQQMGVSKGEGFCFEDSDAGIRSAKLAGLKVAAVEAANYYGFSQSEADLKIHDFREVNLEWLKKAF